MLEKSDLKAIEKIIDTRAKETEKSLKDYVGKTIESSNAKQELNFKDYVGFEIEKSEMKLVGEMEKMEERIGNRVNREITDTSENIRRIAEKIDKVDDHEKRIKKLETAVGKC